MGSKIHFGITKNLKKKIINSRKIIFFLDYDGTLVPIRRKPQYAIISPKRRQVLKHLAAQSWAKVYIISGRTLKNVMQLVRVRQLGYAGNHGFELFDKYLQLNNKKVKAAKKVIAEIYRRLKADLKYKGMILENKTYTLSIHYRMIKKRSVEKFKNDVYNITANYLNKKNIVITTGKKVIEIRPDIAWNKGSIVRWLVTHIKGKSKFPIYIGDDTTDEDAFKALKRSGYTAVVSKTKRKSAARFRLKSTEEVFVFLKHIVRLKND